MAPGGKVGFRVLTPGGTVLRLRVPASTKISKVMQTVLPTLNATHDNGPLWVDGGWHFVVDNRVVGEGERAQVLKDSDVWAVQEPPPPQESTTSRPLSPTEARQVKSFAKGPPSSHLQSSQSGYAAAADQAPASRQASRQDSSSGGPGVHVSIVSGATPVLAPASASMAAPPQRLPASQPQPYPHSSGFRVAQDAYRSTSGSLAHPQHPKHKPVPTKSPPSSPLRRAHDASASAVGSNDPHFPQPTAATGAATVSSAMQSQPPFAGSELSRRRGHGGGGGGAAQARDSRASAASVAAPLATTMPVGGDFGGRYSYDQHRPSQQRLERTHSNVGDADIADVQTFRAYAPPPGTPQEIKSAGWTRGDDRGDGRHVGADGHGGGGGRVRGSPTAMLTPVATHHEGRGQGMVGPCGPEHQMHPSSAAPAIPTSQWRGLGGDSVVSLAARPAMQRVSGETPVRSRRSESTQRPSPHDSRAGGRREAATPTTPPAAGIATTRSDTPPAGTGGSRNPWEPRYTGHARSADSLARFAPDLDDLFLSGARARGSAGGNTDHRPVDNHAWHPTHDPPQAPSQAGRGAGGHAGRATPPPPEGPPHVVGASGAAAAAKGSSPSTTWTSDHPPTPLMRAWAKEVATPATASKRTAVTDGEFCRVRGGGAPAASPPPVIPEPHAGVGGEPRSGGSAARHGGGGAAVEITITVDGVDAGTPPSWCAFTLPPQTLLSSVARMAADVFPHLTRPLFAHNGRVLAMDATLAAAQLPDGATLRAFAQPAAGPDTHLVPVAATTAAVAPTAAPGAAGAGAPQLLTLRIKSTLDGKEYRIPNLRPNTGMQKVRSLLERYTRVAADDQVIMTPDGAIVPSHDTIQGGGLAAGLVGILTVRQPTPSPTPPQSRAATASVGTTETQPPAAPPSQPSDNGGALTGIIKSSKVSPSRLRGAQPRRQVTVNTTPQVMVLREGSTPPRVEGSMESGDSVVLDVTPLGVAPPSGRGVRVDVGQRMLDTQHAHTASAPVGDPPRSPSPTVIGVDIAQGQPQFAEYVPAGGGVTAAPPAGQPTAASVSAANALHAPPRGITWADLQLASTTSTTTGSKGRGGDGGGQPVAAGVHAPPGSWHTQRTPAGSGTHGGLTIGLDAAQPHVALDPADPVAAGTATGGSGDSGGVLPQKAAPAPTLAPAPFTDSGDHTHPAGQQDMVPPIAAAVQRQGGMLVPPGLARGGGGAAAADATASRSGSDGGGGGGRVGHPPPASAARSAHDPEALLAFQQQMAAERRKRLDRARNQRMISHASHATQPPFAALVNALPPPPTSGAAASARRGESGSPAPTVPATAPTAGIMHQAAPAPATAAAAAPAPTAQQLKAQFDSEIAAAARDAPPPPSQPPPQAVPSYLAKAASRPLRMSPPRARGGSSAPAMRASSDATAGRAAHLREALNSRYAGAQGRAGSASTAAEDAMHTTRMGIRPRHM